MSDMQQSDSIAGGEHDLTRVTISTGARLHFGLLDSVEPFGGIGVMIRDPGTTVSASFNDVFTCPDQHLERLCEIARSVSNSLGNDDLPPIRLEVRSDAQSHCGLGSGTQLSLAAAEAMLRLLRLPYDELDLAISHANRGKRSAVGIHGYYNGGMIFESNHPDDNLLNPIQERVTLPSDWHVAVFKPLMEIGQVFGLAEVEKFATLPPAPEKLRESLQQIARRQLVPAARRGDFQEFSQALQVYNCTSGRLFESIQGGPYNGADVTALINWLIRQGVMGVGQSSWGPGVFAWFESESHARRLLRNLPEGIELMALTSAFDQPRMMTCQ